MERKTKVNVEDGRQEVKITRDFELPVDLLFKAYIEADIVEQWMGTKVVKLESKKHGSYHFETTDPKGNIHRFSGVIHELVPDQKITRTFEIENGAMGVQLEFLHFESLTADTSRLNMHVLYESVAVRDQVVKFGMPKGIDMAHTRIQEIMDKLK